LPSPDAISRSTGVNSPDAKINDGQVKAQHLLEVCQCRYGAAILVVDRLLAHYPLKHIHRQHVAWQQQQQQQQQQMMMMSAQDLTQASKQHAAGHGFSNLTCTLMKKLTVSAATLDQEDMSCIVPLQDSIKTHTLSGNCHMARSVYDAGTTCY
jgi:hypothetical protein